MTTAELSSRTTDDDPEPPHSVVRLADGRTLSWTEYGDPNGEPLFFHHGIPSSRVAAAVMDLGAARAGVRLIAPERPGFGYSDPLPNRTILDWPADLRQLADYLEFEKFSVAGISAGLPYTLACALHMPDRLNRVALISGLGAIDSGDVLEGMSYEWRLIYTLFLKSQRLASLWMRGYGRSVQKRPERVVAEQIKRMPPVDGAVLGSEPTLTNRITDLREAFRQGPAAAGDEARHHLEPWGFELRDVQFPVMLWHAMLDESHPIQMGRRIAAELPDCRPIYVDGVGSLGFIEHAESIFNALFSEHPRIPTTVTPVETAPIDEEAEIFTGLLDVLPEPVIGE
ncbi:MAG: alpha/beta hydrolase [Chloroflexi bacterium]|nr:alpha/beta hydrolase [Chloroflexota bacterium]